MLLLSTFLSLLLSATVANALRNDRQLRHRLRTGFGHAARRRRSLPSPAFTVEVIPTHHHSPPVYPMLNKHHQLDIDHFGSGQGTFKNRYWINDTYYDGGPVFGARRTVPARQSVYLSSTQFSMSGRPTPNLTSALLSRRVFCTILRNYRSSVLQESDGVQNNVMALTKKYKGLAILWEHRYYGGSLPFQDKFNSVVRPSPSSP